MSNLVVVKTVRSESRERLRDALCMTSVQVCLGQVGGYDVIVHVVPNFSRVLID